MELKDYKDQFQDFIDATQDSRQLAERDRDYKDHKQWTSAEASILKGRGQAAVVINRIKPKHDFLLGLERQNRTDPKAFPRTPKHEKDAEAITDALRYVADNTDLDDTASSCFDDFACEGYCAVIIEVNGSKDDPVVRQVPWDRFYYDPHSRRKDFKDAAYMGITAWLYRDEAIEMFPDMEERIKSLGPQNGEDETFEDKPLWLDRSRPNRPRVRINEHYFKDKGKWKLCYFTGDVILRDPEDSPFLDFDESENGTPTCPIEANSCHIDRENNRYGALRGLINIQDEINHRRSKALHALSNVTVISDPGVVESSDRMMQQLASGKAHIEKLTDGEISVDRNTEFASGQLLLLQEAKQEIDAVGVNATLAGKDERSLSGRAIQAKQQGGAVELSPIFDSHNHWKKRIYRQIWNRIKQYWTDERWVRVTDDENNIKFVGLNRPITGREVLSQRIGVAPENVEQTLLQGGTSMLPDQLERVIGIENQVSAIDVDIVIEATPDMDIGALQDEQFQMIANLAQSYPDKVGFEDVVALSKLKGKDAFLEKVAGDEQQRDQQKQAAQQEIMAKSQGEREAQQADVVAKLAKARKDNADADAQLLENQLAQMELGLGSA